MSSRINVSYRKAINFTIGTVGLQYNNTWAVSNPVCRRPLIVDDFVARKRCAVSLAFDIVKRMRSDALPLSSPLAND